MLNLDILNKPQKEAVINTEGPLLVLAGAGSGKTRVLTYRLAYILDAGLAGPTNILAVTFTNKASEEMKERIIKLLRENSEAKRAVYIPWVGTFHSICVKILRSHGELVGLGKNFTIYDSSDSLMAVKEAMKRENISTKEFNPNAIRSYISSAKNELVDATDYANYANGYFQQIVSRVYPTYQKVLRENNAVDFDDLLFFAVKLLIENKNILEYYQDQFRYILVDEYQDTNHAQYVLITKLADQHKNICCVGDDDQSIYAFRGATIKNILNFEKDYPDSKIIKLEQNYRSTKKILEASYQVISKNRSRKDKKLWTENDNGENLLVYTASDEVDESRWIVNKIKEIGEDLSEVAVLYRTNAQSRALEEAFLQESLPYKIVGSVRFYERKEIKDVLAYLRLLNNQKDNQSLERIINVPRRGIGEKTLATLQAQASLLNKSLLEYLISNIENLETKLQNFTELMVNLLKKSNELNIVDMINTLLEKTDYIKMLSDGTLENESRIENIKELISVAAKYSELPPQESLATFLEEISLLTNEDGETEDGAKVTLMTIHAAKGLEFKYVFIAGAEEGLFPHRNSTLDEKELEEERRLAYVAITRAKKKLTLTHAKSRVYFGQVQSNPISRFLLDISDDLLERETSAELGSSGLIYDDDADESKWENLLELSIGDKVKHEYFGKGTVTYIDDSIVKVNFGAVYGIKELMLEYAKLEKL